MARVKKAVNAKKKHKKILKLSKGFYDRRARYSELLTLQLCVPSLLHM